MDKIIWTPVIVTSKDFIIKGYHVKSQKGFRVIVANSNIFFDFDKSRIVKQGFDQYGNTLISIKSLAPP